MSEIKYDKKEIQDALIMESMKLFVGRVLDLHTDDYKPWFTFTVGCGELIMYMNIPCSTVSSETIRMLSAIGDVYGMPEPGKPKINVDIRNDTYNLETGEQKFIKGDNGEPLMLLTITFDFHSDDFKVYEKTPAQEE